MYCCCMGILLKPVMLWNICIISNNYFLLYNIKKKKYFYDQIWISFRNHSNKLSAAQETCIIVNVENSWVFDE